VNTASRMETTGLPDRIQISEETASELRKNGCHAWFVPREDEITAKGKGSLRTYWLGVGNPENIVIKEEANTTDLSDGDLTDISEGSNSPPKPKDSSSSKHYRNWVLSEFDNVSC
jgi:Adenylate and Guanylate cyclase catalytic domain